MIITVTRTTPTVETELIRRTLIRDMPDRSRVVAKLEARIAGRGERFINGLSPAFSLTGEIYEQHGTWNGAAQMRNGREMDACGCCHQILRAFPALTRFESMHLADPISGEPMHAEANGWYFYAASQGVRERYGPMTGRTSIYAHQLADKGLSDDDAGREEYCYRTACKILRVDSIPAHLNRASFARFVDDQRECWRYDAADTLRFIQSLPAGNA